LVAPEQVQRSVVDVLTELAPVDGDGDVGAAGVVGVVVVVPAWLIVNVRPAMVSVPVRAAEEFAATVAITVPLPARPAVLRVTQETFDRAVHEQLLLVVTVACVPPPEAGSVAEVGDTENEHDEVAPLCVQSVQPTFLPGDEGDEAGNEVP